MLILPIGQKRRIYIWGLHSGGVVRRYTIRLLLSFADEKFGGVQSAKLQGVPQVGIPFIVPLFSADFY